LSSPADHEARSGPEKHPGLARRLAALAYDLLLLGAAWFVFTLIVLFARGGRAIEPGTWWFAPSLVAVAAGFFVWFWTHGGQTLGMRAWRLRVVGPGGRAISWKRGAGRFFAALVSALPAGLGFWWALVDRDGLCWHDRWTGTRLTLQSKPPKPDRRT
jgi:uncharacterized RDD family membrane protein YckC